MNILRRVEQAKAQLQQTQSQRYRRTALSNADTINDVKARYPEFDLLRSKICQAGTDNLAFFENGYTHEGGLYLQQNPDEFASLCVFLKEHRPYTNYMEIGSASGGACLFLKQEVGFTNAVSLDDGCHARAVEQEKNFSQIGNFRQYIGDSHSSEARLFLENNLDGALDVAFIDGDHSYEGVWQDIELTLPFCRQGTLIVLHDTIACEGVEKAWFRCVKEKIVKPAAEYIGSRLPLGIAIGEVIQSNSK